MPSVDKAKAKSTKKPANKKKEIEIKFPQEINTLIKRPFAWFCDLPGNFTSLSRAGKEFESIGFFF